VLCLRHHDPQSQDDHAPCAGENSCCRHEDWMIYSLNGVTQIPPLSLGYSSCSSQPLAACNPHLTPSSLKALCQTTMSGHGKGGGMLTFFPLSSTVADSGSESRKGRREVSPQGLAQQHPGPHHEAHHVSSRSSRWCQVLPQSGLWRDTWCSQDLGERSSSLFSSNQDTFSTVSVLRLPPPPTSIYMCIINVSLLYSSILPTSPGFNP